MDKRKVPIARVILFSNENVSVSNIQTKIFDSIFTTLIVTTYRTHTG